MNFGEKLRLLREDKGLSQREVAERLKISLRTYASYELNQRRPRTQSKLQEIAEFFGTSADYLQIDDIAKKAEELEDYGRDELHARYSMLESSIVNEIATFMQQLGWKVELEPRKSPVFRPDLLATLNNITVIFEFKLFFTYSLPIRALHSIYGLASTIPIEKIENTYFVVISNTEGLEALANSNPPLNLKIPIKFFTFNQEKNKFNSPELFKFISGLSQ